MSLLISFYDTSSDVLGQTLIDQLYSATVELLESEWLKSDIAPTDLDSAYSQSRKRAEADDRRRSSQSVGARTDTTTLHPGIDSTSPLLPFRHSHLHPIVRATPRTSSSELTLLAGIYKKLSI